MSPRTRLVAVVHPGVHPGYFFDFATEGFLVLSLLPEPTRFAEGVRRLAAHLGEMLLPSHP